MNKSGSIFNSNHIVMYHVSDGHLFATHGRVCNSATTDPSSEGTRGATPPKKYIKYIITFIIISRKAASDIRSRTVSVLEADSRLRFIGRIRRPAYSTAQALLRLFHSSILYKFIDASSLPAENGTPRHLYFKPSP